MIGLASSIVVLSRGLPRFTGTQPFSLAISERALARRSPRKWRGPKQETAEWYEHAFETSCSDAGWTSAEAFYSMSGRAIVNADALVARQFKSGTLVEAFCSHEHLIAHEHKTTLRARIGGTNGAQDGQTVHQH